MMVARQAGLLANPTRDHSYFTLFFPSIELSIWKKQLPLAVPIFQRLEKTMSEIKITQENVSKANRRLQKALEGRLGKKVPLSECAELFARALGAENVHQLSTWLAAAPTAQKVQTILPVDETDLPVEVQRFLGWARPEAWQKTSFTHAFVEFTEYGLVLFVEAPSKKYAPGTEGFGLYWEDGQHPGEYLNKEMKHLDLGAEDVHLLRALTELFFPKDEHMRKQFALLMKRGLGLQKGQSYCLHKKDADFFNEVAGLSACKRLFLVPPPMAEVESRPLGEGYREVASHLEDANLLRFNRFEDARRAAEKLRSLVIQAFEESGSGRLAYDWTFSGGVFTSIGGARLPFKGEDDLVRFQGMTAREKTSDRLPINPFGVNERECALWEEGKALSLKRSLKP